MISVHFFQPSASRKNADRSVITQSDSATASASSAVKDGACTATARGGVVAKPSTFSGGMSEVLVLRTCLSPSSLRAGPRDRRRVGRAALRAEAKPGATVTVLGPGSWGLMNVVALCHLTEASSIVCGARYSAPSGELAREMGTNTVVDPDELTQTNSSGQCAGPGARFRPGAPVGRCRRGDRRRRAGPLPRRLGPRG